MEIVQQYLWGCKTCRLCQQSLPTSEFYKSKANRDGLGAYCRKCNAQKVREWAERNPDRHQAIVKKSNASQRHNIAAHHKAHRQQLNARSRQFQREHPERYAEYTRMRMHRKRSNGGKYTKDEWNALCAKYGNRCACCGCDGKLTVDHIVPVVHGGSNSIDNIQPLCALCNSKKGTRTIDYRTVID